MPEATRRAEQVKTETANVTTEQIEALRQLIPQAFSEGGIDFEKLRAALGDLVDEQSERYSFIWAGKRDAIRLLQVPSRATLTPAPEESVNFETTSNVFIEGENLEVLKLLYKPYFGRVKMIYIDPPYNTGNDFIYPDNYADPLGTYLKLTGQMDENGNLLTSNPETSGRYHSAWLSMMYPRLFLARQLLREDGVIFVSIDDHEVHNLRFLMNEVFGEEGRIECFVWKKSYGGGAKEKYAVTQHEYVLLYAKNIGQIDELWLPPDPEAEKRYYKYRDGKFERRGPYRLKPLEATKSMDRREKLVYGIRLPWGGEVWPKRQWWWGHERTFRALASDELVFTRNGDDVTVCYKQYLRDEEGHQRGAKPFSVIDGIYTQHGTEDLNQLFGDRQIMQFPKPVALLKRLLNMATEPRQGDIVVDFFAGSCGTAQAVLELNREDGGDRRFIMLQLPEPVAAPMTLDNGVILDTIATVGKERIRRVAAKLKKEREGQLDLSDRGTPEDLGFKVFKLAKSNFKQWPVAGEKEPQDHTKQMAIFIDPLAEGWTVPNVICEVAIKEGYGLNCSVENVATVSDNMLYQVTDPNKEQSFYVCLDDTIRSEGLAPLGLAGDDLFICRDCALDDDAAANLALQCRLKTI